MTSTTHLWLSLVQWRVEMGRKVSGPGNPSDFYMGVVILEKKILLTDNYGTRSGTSNQGVPLELAVGIDNSLHATALVCRNYDSAFTVPKPRRRLCEASHIFFCVTI